VKQGSFISPVHLSDVSTLFAQWLHMQLAQEKHIAFWFLSFPLVLSVYSQVPAM
jgi:hypothetical protein